jgi:hypothetical protein
MVLAVGSGIAAASVVTAGTASERLSGGRDELLSDDIVTGDSVPDPRGGYPWAVRIFDGETSERCIVAGRTDGEAFGPVDAKGELHDPGAVPSGSCGDPAAEPVQAAVMRFADSAGTGPRSVFLGVAAANVTRIEVRALGVLRPVTLDSSRTFLVVSDELTAEGVWTVEVGLSDGSTRSYQL